MSDFNSNTLSGNTNPTDNQSVQVNATLPPSPDVASDPSATSSIGYNQLSGMDVSGLPTQSPDQAPAAPAKPGSKWEAILTGALQGMVGGAGQKFFGTGMAAGAGAVAKYNQDQTENNQRQQQIDVQKQAENREQQLQPLRFKFLNAQAASMASDASIKAHEAATWDETHAREVETTNRATADWFMNHGYNPVSVTANDGHSEMAAGASMGTVPPMTSIQVAPNQIMHFDLTQMPKQVGLGYVNDLNKQTGRAQIDPQVWAQTPQAARMQMVNSAAQYWSPLASEDNLTQMQNERARVAALPDAQMPDKATTLAHYDSVIKGLRSTLDQSNQRAIDQKNKVTLGTSGADATAAGRTAYAKGYGDEKGKNDADEASGLGSSSSSNLAGEEYLKTLPPNRASLVTGVINGGIGLSPRQLQTKDGQKLASDVLRVDPSYDFTKQNSYVAVRTEFTKGKAATQLNAGGTAIQHLADLKQINDTTLWSLARQVLLLIRPTTTC